MAFHAGQALQLCEYAFLCVEQLICQTRLGMGKSRGNPAGDTGN